MRSKKQLHTVTHIRTQLKATTVKLKTVSWQTFVSCLTQIGNFAMNSQKKNRLNQKLQIVFDVSVGIKENYIIIKRTNP